MGTKAAWTAERRAKQAERIRQRKPWEQSTGPRTAEGKAISSRNADKGVAELRQSMREFRCHMRALREQAERLYGRFRDRPITSPSGRRLPR
jgi:hypothetical protein